ncbi:M56 family metallopeptidase [Clostridium sp. WILCCON 0269]|uniref:M56 family metallopeptidase n=1 Tax=Candidatus Clostridium eludens TaxID=3381663 RepID=A0ABW8SMX5_9CLOT
MNIFQMSFSAIILIIAVVIIRVLALHKLPKKTFLVLWGVVFCRLLIPFSIPFRFSFYTGMDKFRQVFTEMLAITNTLLKTNAIYSIKNVPHLGQLVASDAKTASILYIPIMIICLAGMTLCVMFFIVTYIKNLREFQTSLPVEKDFITSWLREYPMRRSVQIRENDKINVPLTYGIFRPVVLFPKTTDWTDEIKLRYILTHEFVHIRRFDTLTKLLLAFILCVHWFNPFVWVMYILANRDIELSCDETVVQTFGENIKSAYAMTLIGMAEKKNKLTPLCNNFSKNAIEERIVSIMKMKKVSFVRKAFALLLVVGVSAVFATNSAVKADSLTNNATTDAEKMPDYLVNEQGQTYEYLTKGLKK